MTTPKTMLPYRIALGVLLALVALNAIGGAIYGLNGANGVPREWLAESPFPDYFIPSLLLLAVGVVFVIATIITFVSATLARNAALGAGILLFAWLLAELMIIGFVSWLQPVTFLADFAVLGVAWMMPRPERPQIHWRSLAH